MKEFIRVGLFLLLVSACKEDDEEYKRFYYDNGIVMKEGYFNKKGLPVDTLKTYLPSGKLQWIEVYDKDGILNGPSVLYYGNGQIAQRKFFLHNKLNGWFYNYFDNGKIKSIGYYCNGILQGDRIHFYRNGRYKAYNFLDFKGQNLIVHLFDSVNNNRIEKKGDLLVADSIVYQHDSISLIFLMSHPPFAKNVIHVDKIDINSKNIESFELPDSSRLFNVIFLKTPSLKSVALRVEQHDSILNTFNEWNSLYNLHE